MDAAAELGRNAVSKHHIQPEYGDEQADAGRDCRTPSRETKFSGANGDREKFIFSIQLTTSSFSNYPVDSYPCYCIDYVMTITVNAGRMVKHESLRTVPIFPITPRSLHEIDSYIMEFRSGLTLTHLGCLVVPDAVSSHDGRCTPGDRVGDDQPGIWR